MSDVIGRITIREMPLQDGKKFSCFITWMVGENELAGAFSGDDRQETISRGLSELVSTMKDAGLL